MKDEIIEQNLLDEYNKMVEEDAILPIKITSFYMKKIKEEIKNIGTGGPLYKSVLPLKEKLR